jgi:tetratricopeptide (TPR) repeat protein
MAKFDVFVGRQEELALIDRWAQQWGTTHLIALDGDGGVGKTWLLLEVLRRYRLDDRYVLVYLDAAEHPYSPWYDVRFVAQQLGEEHFPELLTGMDDLSYTYLNVVKQEYKAREEAVLRAGIDEINRYLETRRLVYLGDTLEVWHQSRSRGEPVQGLSECASGFSNALFILAGRDMMRQLPGYQVELCEEATLLGVTNFDRDESNEFFQAVDPEGRVIAPDLRDKLHLLTNGRPVLLTLAYEWLRHDVPLPEITDRSLADLQALPPTQMAALCEQFEFELVTRVRGLTSPLDRAVLYMASIDQRINAPILSVLLGIPLPEAEALFDRIVDLSFVRHNPQSGNCMLHDEMKALVNRHAWPYADMTGEVRRKLARRVIDGYYLPRIAELTRQAKEAQQAKDRLDTGTGPLRRETISREEWERWRLESECLVYHLQLGEEEGLRYFEERFLEARRNNQVSRMHLLLSELESAGRADLGDTVELRRAESLRIRGEVDEARAICERALAQEGLSLENQTSAYVTLGLIAAATDPEEAEAHYRAALTLAEERGNVRIQGTLHNNLGQLYRAVGRLTLAVEQYQAAIRYGKETENWALVAAATNNLAYVYRMLGNLPQADAMCRVALAQRKQLGLERDLAYSYLNKAEIDRDKGDLESAERYSKLALRDFDKLDERRGQALAYQSLANIHRHLGQFEQAEAYVKEGLTLAEELGDQRLCAGLYSVYGREQRDEAVHAQEMGDERLAARLYRRAQQYQEQSWDLAERYGDPWLEARSQYELALTYFLARTRPESEIDVLLDGVWEDAVRLEHVLLQGYVQELRGELALRQGDYDRAAQQLGLATVLMGQRASRESNRFFDRISDYLLAEDLAPENAATLARGILAVLAEHADAGAQALCQQILDLQTM